MLSALVVFTSCSLKHDAGSNSAENRRKVIATSMHNATMGQMQVNTDPFNIAFRLNTLMVESEPYGWDVNHAALAAMRQNLLGAQTTITVNADVYTLSLQGQGKYDYIHTGVLVIHTNGAPLSNGNAWILDIPETANYRFSLSGTTVGLHADNYVITSAGDNKWEIQIGKLVANRPETEYSAAKSNWSGKITVTQDQFDNQGLEAVSKSTYSMDIESHRQITTMYVTDTMSVKTLEPLQFNPECAQGQVVGAGQLQTAFTFSWSGPLDFTLSEWKGEGVKCDPEIEVQYYGTVEE